MLIVMVTIWPVTACCNIEHLAMWQAMLAVSLSCHCVSAVVDAEQTTKLPAVVHHCVNHSNRPCGECHSCHYVAVSHMAGPAWCHDCVPMASLSSSSQHLDALHLQHSIQGAASSRNGEATSSRTPKPAKIPTTCNTMETTRPTSYVCTSWIWC